MGEIENPTGAKIIEALAEGVVRRGFNMMVVTAVDLETNEPYQLQIFGCKLNDGDRAGLINQFAQFKEIRQHYLQNKGGINGTDTKRDGNDTKPAS